MIWVLLFVLCFVRLCTIRLDNNLRGLNFSLLFLVVTYKRLYTGTLNITAFQPGSKRGRQVKSQMAVGHARSFKANDL